MGWKRIFLGLAALLVTPVVLVAVWISLFGWNWLRAPIERAAAQNTGRALAIQGDLSLHLAWPSPTVRAQAVTFANPAWAREKQMLTADAVELTLNIPQLLMRNVVLPTVHLVHPIVFLEQDAKGKKNWLLDLEQQDESARVRIGQLTLDDGTLGFDDHSKKTHVRSRISTIVSPSNGASPTAAPSVVFTATGQFNGLAVKASGRGGKRPQLSAQLTSKVLDLDDLAPVVGKREASEKPRTTAPKHCHWTI